MKYLGTMRNTQNCWRLLKLATLLAFIFPSLCVASVSEDVYGYKKNETEGARKKFVLRLTEDNKKIDFAIENTKSLIDRSRTRPYLPELYIRLAELYIEKSRVVYFLRNSGKTGAGQKLQLIESDTLKIQAIEIYQNILSHFSDYEARDKVHFFMAHEYRELKQMDEMVKQYQAVVKKYKTSPYAAEAYLLLGDYYFSKQNFDKAKKYYEAIFSYRDSPVVAIARYKLGWIEINKGDYKKAISLFEESVTSVAAGEKLNVDTYKKANVKLEALVDMAYAYTEVYKESPPEEAISFFREYSWSQPVFSNVLEKLANRYFLKKKWESAAVLYRYLSSIQEDSERLLEYAGNIFESTKSLNTFEKADKDMEIIIKALRKQRYSLHIADETKEKNVKQYEVYARDIVTHLHKKATSTAVVSEFKRAASAYKTYLGFFTKSPVYDEMEINFADALFFAKDFVQAGKMYEKLAKKFSGNKEEREEKLFSSVVSYYNALKEKEKLKYYETVFAREGLKETGRMFVADFPGSKKVPNVLFNVAWVTYDSGEYDEALASFKDFVNRYPRGDEGRAAVHLILDIYRTKELYEDLVRYGHAVVENTRITDTSFKKEVSDIVLAAEGKIVNNLTISALRDEDSGRERIDQFIEKHKSTSLGEQALLALIGPSRERGNFDAVYTVGKQLIDDYPDSARTKETLNVLIESSLKATQFRLLANYLEMFAEKLPNHTNTPDFLLKAAQIRETLGEYRKVNKNYEILLRSPLLKDPDKQTQIIFALANSVKETGDLDYEYKLLMDTKPYLSEPARVKADAMIADYYFEKRMMRTAKEYTKKVKSAFNSRVARRDQSIKALVAKLAYSSLELQYKKYMKISMGDRVEKSVVKAKSDQLKELEKGYLEVIKYQSPEWALAACYRSFEINNDFARFISESPVASYMSGDVRAKYLKVVARKAETFRKKGEEYQQTCAEQVHKWEMTDPRLVKYYFSPDELSDQAKDFDYFSGETRLAEISEEFLENETLTALHSKLLKEPGDFQSLFSLALAYAQSSDYRQAILIARKLIDEAGEEDTHLKAAALNAVGVFYLYIRDDNRARDSFKKALEISPESIAPS
ncbi:MAG: tetratricopeptide repeat protein, partial [Nitrospinota bacterium]